MSKQFIFVNGDGDYEQGGSTYEASDFVSSSAGAGDAGKPVILDAGGRVDGTMIDDTDIDHNNLTNSHNLTTDIDHDTLTNTHNLTTDIDHDQLTNFLAIEHLDWSSDVSGTATINDANVPNVALLDGSRDFTSVVSYDSSKTFTADAEIVDKKYVDDAVAGSGTSAEWQDSCLDILLTPPGSPSTGDRYLINGTGTGAWAGQDYDIAEWNGSSWDFTTPTTGTFVGVDDETDGIYYFGGSGPWTKSFFESTTASLGVEKVGLDIRLDLLASGGLKLTGNEVGVEPNDFAGEGLVDDGSDNLAIDWSTAFNDAKAVKAEDLNSTATGEGASIIGIEDAGGYTTETDVEGALQEIYGELGSAGNGVEYTVGTGGVSAGDLLYVSGNDTVLPYSTITNAEIAIGLAETTVSAGGTVNVLANDTILSGILTGATAGTKYYWTGSGWTTNFASFSSGEYIWTGGVAKNGTDVHVEVDFVMKKA